MNFVSKNENFQLDFQGFIKSPSETESSNRRCMWQEFLYFEMENVPTVVKMNGIRGKCKFLFHVGSSTGENWVVNVYSNEKFRTDEFQFHNIKVLLKFNVLPSKKVNFDFNISSFAISVRL